MRLRPRCSVQNASQGRSEGFAHTWSLRMPCGLQKVSHAAEPPITVSCSRPCPVKPQPRFRLPTFDF